MEKWLENEGCFIIAEENWDSEVLEVAFLHVGYNLYCISITHPLNKKISQKKKEIVVPQAVKQHLINLKGK